MSACSGRLEEPLAFTLDGMGALHDAQAAVRERGAARTLALTAPEVEGPAEATNAAAA